MIVERPPVFGADEVAKALMEVLPEGISVELFYKALEVYEDVTCASCGDYDPNHYCQCWNDE